MTTLEIRAALRLTAGDVAAAAEMLASGSKKDLAKLEQELEAIRLQERRVIEKRNAIRQAKEKKERDKRILMEMGLVEVGPPTRPGRGAADYAGSSSSSSSDEEEGVPVNQPVVREVDDGKSLADDDFDDDKSSSDEDLFGGHATPEESSDESAEIVQAAAVVPCVWSIDPAPRDPLPIHPWDFAAKSGGQEIQQTLGQLPRPAHVFLDPAHRESGKVVDFFVFQNFNVAGGYASRRRGENYGNEWQIAKLGKKFVSIADRRTTLKVLGVMPDKKIQVRVNDPASRVPQNPQNVAVNIKYGVPVIKVGKDLFVRDILRDYYDDAKALFEMTLETVARFVHNNATVIRKTSYGDAEFISPALSRAKGPSLLLGGASLKTQFKPGSESITLQTADATVATGGKAKGTGVNLTINLSISNSGRPEFRRSARSGQAAVTQNYYFNAFSFDMFNDILAYAMFKQSPTRFRAKNGAKMMINGLSLPLTYWSQSKLYPGGNYPNFDDSFKDAIAGCSSAEKQILTADLREFAASNPTLVSNALVQELIEMLK